MTRMKSRFKTCGGLATLLVALCIAVPSPVVAVSSDEPVYDRLVETLKHDWLSVGVLLQVVGDVQDERNSPGQNGFSIANARLSLSGELDGGFGYFLQGNFADSPTLLDGKMHFKVNRALMVDAGLFKAPFSAEFLISAANIDFVNRSRVVAALAPGREIGAQVRGAVSKERIRYRVGLFNGNRFDERGNDNDHFLYAGRLELNPRPGGADSGSELAVGVNLATSRDEDASFLGGDVGDFDGRRNLVGVDARWARAKWLLSGEAIWSKLDRDAGPTVRPSGFHATIGRMVGEKSQLLLRWDSLSNDGLTEDTELVILGYNLWPTKVSEFQLNYVIPDEGGLDSHQLLVNTQIAF